eukprot:gene7734-906_t
MAEEGGPSVADAAMLVDAPEDREDADLALEDPREPQGQLGVASVMPAHLNRVLYSYMSEVSVSNKEAGGSYPALVAHDLILNVAHAVMLETGFKVHNDTDTAMSVDGEAADCMLRALSMGPFLILCAKVRVAGGKPSVLQTISLDTRQYILESTTLGDRLAEKKGASKAVGAAASAVAPSLQVGRSCPWNVVHPT